MGILTAILKMSVTGSIIFLIYFLISPLTKKNFSSSWHYGMLIMILTFFIMPIGSLVKLPQKSIFNLPSITKPREFNGLDNITGNKDTEDIWEAQKIQDIEENRHRDKTEGKETNLTKTEDRSPSKNDFNIDSHKHIGLYVWISGMAILFLSKIISYVGFKSAVLANSAEITDENTSELFKSCKTKLNINSNVTLRRCKSVGSPMLIGIFNPTVLIPNTDEDKKALKMIFLHELNHHKRKDIIVKYFSFIINVIHWFNPITYILLKKIDLYCEYSIDEKVADEMKIEDRKYYGQTILELIDNSIVKKNAFTTAMGTNAKELKSRLQNMLFFKKNSGSRRVVSLIVSLLILVSGFTVACDVMPGDAANVNNSLVTFLKEDGLYFTYLDGGEEIKIHEGDSFEFPLVSKSGNYIAYTQNGSLYIYDIKNGEYEKVADEINHYYIAYDWVDDENIVYATKNSGFAMFNASTKETKVHSDEHYYDSFKAAGKNIVYARSERRWATEEGNFGATDGVVEINLNEYDSENKTFSTDIIIEGRRTTDEMIGYVPIVWNISGDGKYIYIMEKPESGSLSADGIGIGIYDVDEKTHTEFMDIGALRYKTNLAINPKNNNLIGLIEGGGREMIENKEAILLNINEDKTYETINFMDRDLVAMTPSFTLDGEKLLYSATKNLKGISITDLNDIYGNIYAGIYDVWENQPHNIYEYDLKTSEVKKVTDGKHFDFMPMSISKDEILFIRYKGDDLYSLIKLANGEESIIVDDIIFSGGSDGYVFGYYGNIYTEQGMDIFVNR